MLTGGFRTATVMKEAITSNQLDIVGLARPFCVFPNIANEVFNESRTDFTTNIKKTNIKAIDAAMNIVWYEAQIRRISNRKEPDPELSSWAAFLKYSWLIVEHKFSKK